MEHELIALAHEGSGVVAEQLARLVDEPFNDLAADKGALR
jgi:hypothetical protein